MVNNLLLRSSWRFFTRHPWQLWLTLLSIALGTAVMVAVDLANMTANKSFRHSVSVLAGPMTHEIIAREGEISEDFYTQLRVQWGMRDSSPQLTGSVRVAGLQYTLLGIDPFAIFLQSQEGFDLPPDTLPRLLIEPNSVLISSDLAERQKIEAGDKLIVALNQGRSDLTVLAVVDVKDDIRLANLIVTDIATAQTLLGKPGVLSRIQLRLDESQVSGLEARLPANYRLASYQDQQQSFSQMTEAFRINLTAMSLLAMLVGAFLVYNTMTFSVLQRRQAFAINRMVGTTALQLFRHMLLEALILGLVGSALGVLLGVVLGQGLLILVTQTISDLYVSVDTSDLLITPWLILKGMAITLLAVLAATLAPALEAARVQPVFVYRASHLEHTGQRLSRWLLLTGIACMAISPLMIEASGRSLLIGFFALFLFIVGYSLIIPMVLKGIMYGLQRLPVYSLYQRMTFRGVQASLSRTSLAIVALTVAVSATVGVSIMVGSFRASVADWLEDTLQSDLYISATTGSSSRIEGTLDSTWLQRVQALPGIASISTGRNARLEVDGISVPMLVLKPGEQSGRGFEYLHGDRDDIWQAFLEDEVILVSEPFAYHHKVQAGDNIRIQTGKSGVIELEIAGIYQDYSATQGMVVMPRRIYEKHWADRGISTIGLMLENDTDVASVTAQLQSWAGVSEQAVMVRSNKTIRDFSLQVFDRTFAITNVLRLLVVIVAFVGVFSALMALFLEKGREFSILRATGLTPLQLRRLVLLQSALIGLLAGLLSLPLGWIMSDILIEVINQRSFGWTMQSYFFASLPFQAVLLSMLAALLAGLYPTRRISRISLREGLRSL
jgi:putative ABC transport system permease protein